MRKLLVVWGFVAGGLLALNAQPIPIYENYEEQNFFEDIPQIDAIAFANYGTFNIFTTTYLPFDFQNTLYFTNTGSMSADTGFMFDTASSTSPRRPASSFVNTRSGVISVSGAPAWLSIQATNILSRGLLSSSAEGLLRIDGSSVDLERGGIEIRPAQASGFAYQTPSNFVPDTGILDVYWGGITNDVLDVTSLLNMVPDVITNFATPPHLVTNASGFVQTTLFGVNRPIAGVRTNQIDPTNTVVQAFFVSARDTNLSVRGVFNAGRRSPYATIAVELAMSETNIVSDDLIFHTVYFVDRLPADTNWVMLTNLNTGTTFRPAVYEVTRDMPLDFALGGPGNSYLTNNLFDMPEFLVLPDVTNIYAAYAVEIQSQALAVPPVPNASITNYPGRIELVADELNLKRTRVRGNSLVTIQTPHLLSTEGAVLDGPNLYYQLGSRTGQLNVQNLAREQVARLQGDIRAWSGLWTNQISQVTTNVTPDPNDPSITVTNLATNNVNYIFHVLALNADLLGTREPVQVHSLELQSTNMVISDRMTVIDKFLAQGDALTIDGRLTLSGSFEHFAASNAPTLKYLTNHGIFSVPDIAYLGADRDEPYLSIVNTGTNSASAHRIWTHYFQNSGVFSSAGRLDLRAHTAKLEGGINYTGGELLLEAHDLKFHSYTNFSSGRLYLDITNSLADSGGGSGTIWSLGDGVQMWRKPPFGDLLGTDIQTTAPRYAVVDHIWAGEDRGLTPNGFEDNVAIGQLTLAASTFGVLEFRGAGAANGLYVDNLNLDGFVRAAFDEDDLGSVLEIAPNLTVYFAYANVPVEELDGQLGGRLRWVKDFAGPISGTDLAMPSGRTVRVNRGVIESTQIDSDEDGVANAFDPTPLGDDRPVLSVTVFEGPASYTRLTWLAAPLTHYVVEYTTGTTEFAWQILTSVTNSTLQTQPVTVDDPINAGEPHKYYRVRYSP